MQNIESIAAALAPHGLIPRGGFVFGDGEDTPVGPSGAPARSVLLVGNAGAGYWRHFSRWRESRASDLPNPLDTWSRAVIGAVAEKAGARAVSPSDRPYLPFQQWAMRAERLKPSPLGILMHPVYGLWHAYRGALLFDEELSIAAPDEQIYPCDLCEKKPCLTSCPVTAYSDAGFAHDSCLCHVRSDAGRACGEAGCIARNACPHGAYQYPADVQAFHMESFAGTGA